MNDNEFGFVSFDEPNSVPEAQDDIGFVSFDQLDQKQPQKKESFSQSALRNVARTGSRITETIAGLPGDIIQTTKAIGEKLPEVPKFLEGSPSPIREPLKKAAETLPTSKKLKQKATEQSKGYLEPRNELESFADDVFSDAASLLLPGKTKIPFAKSLGVALAGNSAKEFAKEAGVGDTGQFLTKLGTMFFAGSLKPGQADKLVKSLYEKSHKAVPKDTMLNSDALIKNADKLENELKKGLSTSTKEPILKDLKELKNKGAGGAIPFEDVIESYRNINEKMTSKHLFETLNKPEQKILKQNYNKLKDVLSQSLNDYGKHNPEFINNWRAANEGYSAIQQSKRISNSLKKAFQLKHVLTSGPAYAFLHYLHPAIGMKTIAGTAAGFGFLKGSELAARFAKSPNLRRHYLNLIKDSAEENIPGLIKNISKLNEDLEFTRLDNK